MGINPLGSNKKARTTLIFNRNEERFEFKNAIADIAFVRNASPSATVLALVLENLASTPEAREIARMMYACKEPHCLDGFGFVFQDLAANGEQGHDSEPIIRALLKLTSEFRLHINTADDNANLLIRQWHSLIDVLESIATYAEPETILAVDGARDLRIALENPSTALPIFSMLFFMHKNWSILRTQSCTYRTLCCFVRMAFPFPAYFGDDETAETRLAFLRVIDNFYSDGKEESF